MKLRAATVGDERLKGVCASPCLVVMKDTKNQTSVLVPKWYGESELQSRNDERDLDFLYEASK